MLVRRPSPLRAILGVPRGSAPTEWLLTDLVAAVDRGAVRSGDRRFDLVTALVVRY